MARGSNFSAPVYCRAEEWYQEQLASVQERMRNIVKTGGTRPDTEITRERMVFQLARLANRF
jgi:hypothetical protein